MVELTHIDRRGKAQMVNVSGKPAVYRESRAAGTVKLNSTTIDLIAKNEISKGDVLSTAKIAGIQGAKKTGELIPLCHQIQLDHIDLSFDVRDGGIDIESVAVCRDRTGVEMEAIAAVAIAAVTIYDMCKAVDASITITNVRLLSKRKESIT